MGSYISKLIFFYLFLLNLEYEFKQYKFLYILILLLSLFIILISGDRAALGIFILTFFLMLFLIDNSYVKKISKLIVFLSSVIIFIFLISFSKAFKERFINQTLNDFKTADKIIYFSEGHESHWKSSYKMFLNNKVFGQGPNMFRYYCDYPEFKISEKSCSTHPHNYFIQLFAETGLIGFILFVSVYLIIFLKLFKQFFIINFLNKSYLSIQNLMISIIFFQIFGH